MAPAMTPSVPAVPSVTVTQPGPTNPAPAVPPVMPEYFARYGKILQPGDEVSHPIKLAMPFPGVGEIKVPNADELNSRAKLEQLAALSDSEILTQLTQWPAFSKMTLGDEGALLARIQQYKDRRAKMAKMKASELGLLTLTPDQMARFEKEYWDKRVEMDRELVKQIGPIVHAREMKLQEELFREFSTPTNAGPLVVQAPKSPAPAASKPPLNPATTNAPPMVR